MSLKADVLKTNPNKIKSIMKEVSSILGHIDDEIKAAYDRDENHVSVTVPITFAVPYMSNKNAQRAVYYKILESLLERGFETQLHLASDRTIFFIKWMTEDEEREVDMQNALLAKHSVKIEKKKSKD